MAYESEYEEGRAAAAAGLSFRDACPYSFAKAGVSVEDFDLSWRPRMDAWFKGWSNWLAERNLGFDFTPRRTRKSVRTA